MVLRGCPICGARALRFDHLPGVYAENWQRYGFPYRADDFETLNAWNYACPSCSASDRDRMYAVWIARRADRNGRLLDVGPSTSLTPFLRRRFEYVSLDLDGRVGSVQGDVQQLPFADDSMTAFICSHVLEHVWDDRRALRELRRVLRPGGWGIVMTPICLRVRTLAEAEGVSPEIAWQMFGQSDHVRLYNRTGFLERVTGCGFRIFEWRPRVLDRWRYGLARGSVLYVVS
jgi:SAM-dependent methyltransferase